MKSVHVELINPGRYASNKAIKSIALFTRDQAQMDTTVYTYFYQNKPIKDNSIHYRDNYNTCIQALTDRLQKESHFTRVINCRDSLNDFIQHTDSLLVYNELFKMLNVDALLFLDRYKISCVLFKNNDTNFEEVIASFPEFKSSILIANVWGSLLYNLRIKDDSNKYVLLHTEDLYYGNSIHPDFFGNAENHRKMIKNASEYFGNFCAGYFIPYWQLQHRFFYVSRDTAMVNGSNYCMEGKWLKAAESYKRLTTSNDPVLSACASFNMAVVSEMEGDLEAALDWISISDKDLKNLPGLHKENCKIYRNLLEHRKKDIELLDQLNND